jgi:hypothetical protein
MFAFDWTLKDIVNLRHSPCNLGYFSLLCIIEAELTHSIYWFYINSLYFPYNALQIAEEPVERFVDPIL